VSSAARVKLSKKNFFLNCLLLKAYSHAQKFEKLKIPVILDVAVGHCARAFFLGCLALKVKTVWSFESS